ncbi:hypothetical protein DXG03_007783 [Asterophora parasitica]|uniref:GH16 domain-containing protein n=1 Tax=Asterophora parasitica TaxID=117018 RepID=A0A9P7GCA2_9AGAR|nr:hypothetical protein DXG03_007783 [Asterophora parasitica]
MFNPAVFVSVLFIASLFDGSAAAGARVRDNARRSRYVARKADAEEGKSWKQIDRYQGDNFLDEWKFFDEDDPTHGMVNYQNVEAAKSKGLAVVKHGQLILSVDDTTQLPPKMKRDSVRISTKKTYNGGLFIADFAAMPVGCSVWPAWWSVGPNWPQGGEIDILEGVHNQETNQYTLHTGAGCSLDSSVKATGRVLGTTCASSGKDNTGCAFMDTDTRSYGRGFNGVGGGVFAHLWDSAGIKIWHFARNEIPQDIQDGHPTPAAWPSPAASFATSACDVRKHFHDHALTIDTTLCGDWAGATYKSAGCPGTCAEAVADPKNFVGESLVFQLCGENQAKKNTAEAKWKINYISVYQ